ncbi:hypothetical protein [Anaerocaecibacter muris]|uniref:hypothetical protein n=1 Tax=Anaerocaecibacter muris TaxID=2941513 RepID=UPI003F692DC7
MATIKELKQENKNALRYIHDCYGFDFQKPVTIIKKISKFTAKTIINCLSKEIDRFPAEDYETVLLIRHYNYCNELDNLHAVTCDGDRFTVDVPRGYKYDVGTFYNKRVFEDVRKTRTAYYYIIAQKKEHLYSDASLKPDYTERFDYFPNRYEQYCDGNGNTYFGRIHIARKGTNAEPFEYNTRYKNLKNLSDIIDKSGYIVCEYRSELKRRVCGYKNKKRKNEFLATDYSATVNALDGIFENMKTEIADVVKNIKTYSQARSIERAVDNFAWGLSYFTTYRKRITEKEYDSKQHAESAEQNIRSYLNGAYGALREAINETDDK